MPPRESDTLTTIVAVAAIAQIICVATLCGLDDTLVKLGIATIAGIAGFCFYGIIRRP